MEEARVSKVGVIHSPQRIHQAKSVLLQSSKKEMRVGRWEARKSLFHPDGKLNPNVSLFVRYVIFTILLRIMPLL